MANEVFANGREISCKSGDGKSICEFPDVCMTPPTTAATPMGVPIPYPNTAFSRDATEGSRTVKIDQKEVMLQDASYYKTSTGDEAGCATPAKKGIISGTIKGKMYFIAWSMDVSIEGKHVVRTADMTTHNHASKPGTGSVPTGDIEGVSAPAISKVEEVLCDCCGKPAHTAMQKSGNSLTEEEFFSPSPKNLPKGQTIPAILLNSKETLARIRSGPCKNLLPPAQSSKKTKCNKYYVADITEKKKIEIRWDSYREKYYKKTKVKKSTSIGHRVPKQAGGCPTGFGNLTAEPEGCAEAESEITKLQNAATNYHRRRLGMR